MAFDLGFLGGISTWQVSIGAAALLILIFAAVHFTHRRSYKARIIRIKKEDEELTKYVQKFLRAHSDVRRLKAHAKKLHPMHSKERPGTGKPHANNPRHNVTHKANVHLPITKGKPSLANRLAGRLRRKKRHEQKHEIVQRKETEKRAAPKRMEAHLAEKPEHAPAKRESPKEERRPPSKRGESAAHSTPPVQKEDESRVTGHVDKLLSGMKGPPPPARIPQHVPTSEWLKMHEMQKKQDEQETPEEEEEQRPLRPLRPLYVKTTGKKASLKNEGGEAAFKRDGTFPQKAEPAAEKTQEEKQQTKPKQSPEAVVQDMKYELTQVRQRLDTLRRKGRDVSGLDADADRLRRTLNLGSMLKQPSLTKFRRKLTSLHKRADKVR